MSKIDMSNFDAYLESTIHPTEEVMREIMSERDRQNQKWGGQSHDDKHSDFDWLVYITKHVGKAVKEPFDPIIFRKQMICVAALAAAAVEWVDRKTAAKTPQE